VLLLRQVKEPIAFVVFAMVVRDFP